MPHGAATSPGPGHRLQKINRQLNGPWQGVVTGYFVEDGYQGIEVDCTGHKRPAYYEKQGGDPKRVLFFGVDLMGVETT